jgi:polyisoprenoid-binding protein YceI
MTAVRIIDGIELPATGEWEVDPGHAEVAFIGRHFGLTKIRGRFTEVTGTVTIADDIARSAVAVEIAMASVDSGNQTRDDHLRSDDLFDVGAHPSATFVSAEVTVQANSGHLTGELTIKGTTRPVTLDVEYLGHAIDPWSNERAVFSASTTINREDWGLNWNMILDTGGLLVSKQIRLEIDVELIRRQQP